MNSTTQTPAEKYGFTTTANDRRLAYNDMLSALEDVKAWWDATEGAPLRRDALIIGNSHVTIGQAIDAAIEKAKAV